MELKQKVVLITGASSGIGAELARQLAEKGAQLMLAARSEDALNEVAEVCRDAGSTVAICKTDVTSPDECRMVVEKTIDQFGQLDILVNNAGMSMWARLEEIKDPSIFERLMKVNYLGAAYCCWHALPHLKKRKGLIVGVSSLTGKTGVPTRSAYAASKHALQGFLDSIRVELMESGVNVLVVSPGFVATPIRSNALGADGTRIGASGSHRNDEAMTVEHCVGLMVRAMEKRKRELVMTFKARLGMWVKLIAPGLVDRTALRETTRFAPKGKGEG